MVNEGGPLQCSIQEMLANFQCKKGNFDFFSAVQTAWFAVLLSIDSMIREVRNNCKTCKGLLHSFVLSVGPVEEQVSLIAKTMSKLLCRQTCMYKYLFRQ